MNRQPDKQPDPSKPIAYIDGDGRVHAPEDVTIVCTQADQQAVSRLREDMTLILEAVTQADPGQPHVEFANIECIAARALGVESEVWT